MIRPLAVIALLLPLLASARIERSAAEVMAFKRMTNCPATGKPELRCKNHQVDHVIPLCAGGSDTRDNMQYLTIEEHRWKTRTDVRVCRELRKSGVQSPAQPGRTQ
jgi:5-methylcytosine-specific restriction endonuclease McrA